MLESTVPYLKAHPGYVSGEEISRKLGLSRAAVWKHIRELRQIGYVIEAVPRQGYKLISSPDKLFAWEIQDQLGTRLLGRDIFYHESVSSTMDEATRLASQGAPEGTLVCAEAQTRGRGRLGRPWNSPPGQGIYFSVILRPALALGEAAKLTLVAAVAICQALRQVSGLDVLIKWPNDLFVSDKKLAGILTELQAEMDRIKFVILGVGINVNTASRQLPATGTSLKLAAGHPFSRIELAQEVLRSLERGYGLFLEQGFGPVHKEWKALTMMLGRRVQVIDGGREIQGQAVDLAGDGGLLVRTADGQLIKKMTGDVVVLR